MGKHGRPPVIQGALAYDYRRYITLVQVLAMGGSDEGIRALCERWGVDVIEDRSEPPYKGRYSMNVWATIIALAQHAVEYHKQEREG